MEYTKISCEAVVPQLNEGRTLKTNQIMSIVLVLVLVALLLGTVGCDVEPIMGPVEWGGAYGFTVSSNYTMSCFIEVQGPGINDFYAPYLPALTPGTFVTVPNQGRFCIIISEDGGRQVAKEEVVVADGEANPHYLLRSDGYFVPVQ